MRAIRERLLAGGGALLMSLCGGAPAVADDTEIFVNTGAGGGVRPNVLLIIDTSGSMDTPVGVSKAPYDPTRVYTGGGCQAGRVYWRKGSGAPPDCASAPSVPVSANRCAAAAAALNGPAGLWTGRTAQWAEEHRQWRALSAQYGDAPIECEADAGVHGPDAGSRQRWARNGVEGNPWTDRADDQIGWSSASVHTLYSANWLNWYHGPPEDASVSRMDIVKSVVTTLAYSIDGVNLGLMRFSQGGGRSGRGSEGGMVIHAAQDIASRREAVTEKVGALEPDGMTPLTQTLYEAALYLSGGAVDYGRESRPMPSVPESRRPEDPSRYRSPIEYQCQRNFVILLTDGEPSDDSGMESKLASLPGFNSIVGSCDGSGGGHCLDDLAKYLFSADLSPALPGTQNAVTYAIGFGPDVAGSELLSATARAGGGALYSADDVTGLLSAIQQIMGDIMQSSSTFTTPTVAVNAFNRTRSLDALYISVFRPEETLRWPGNLKRYAVRDGRIVDAVGRDAIDPATGFFRRGAQSFWSATPDDDRVDAGGAASRLPDPAQRRLFTHIAEAGASALTAPANAFDLANTRLTDELLGTGAPDLTREQLILWARGVDVRDEDGDGETTDARRSMGDPLHARPAIVSYGGSAANPDPEDIVVFVPTNDGFLHAVDARTGRELWAFIPQELLGRLADLYRDPAVASRTYGLDGDVRVLRFDADQDGAIDPSAGDKVWIYFGMRRGGRHYYALDVTDRARPELLWKIGPAELPGVGETWSPPTIARVRVGGAAQNGEHFVLIFGGGYDEAQENYTYTTDASGHRIYMVDAASGRLLWYAGGPGGTGSPDLPLAQMTHSIPARISVIDTDGDQYADRMYAADLGGRIWRFDIWNGRSRGQLVTGGVLANLGAAGESEPSIQNTRRFYYAPDVSLVQRRGADPYYNLAIGSGYRGHPLHTGTHDRFYSVRDTNPFGRLTQSEYATLAPITEADLVDITGDIANATVPATARGWKLELRLNGGWVGEKVLAEAVTVNGVVLFPTYQPQSPEITNPCVPVNGLNRVYALQVDTGRPAVDFTNDLQLTAADAFTVLSQTGIAGEVSLLFETQIAAGGGTGGQDDSEGGNGAGSLLARRSVCMVGVEVLRSCVQPGGVVRTFWRKTSTE